MTETDTSPEACERLAGFFFDRASYGFTSARPEAATAWDRRMKQRAQEAHDIIRALAAERDVLRAQLTTARTDSRNEGLREAAALARGEVYMGRYRTWPWWKNADGSQGNRDKEDRSVIHSDDISAAILARIKQPATPPEPTP